MPDTTIRRVIDSYDDLLVRAYCLARFTILRQRFLTEIEQYLPKQGEVLEVGCGIGLFSLYFALHRPNVRFRGIDLNARRIAFAQRAAARLGLTNVVYEVGDARTFLADRRYAGAYILDVVHHIPPDAVGPLLAQIHGALEPEGRLVIKDVDANPTWQRRFTHALDLAMSPRSPPHYWRQQDLQRAAEEAGFVVYHHAMVDVLPYPHLLYVCERH